VKSVDSVTAKTDPADVWAVLRAQPHPLRAFLRFVCAQADHAAAAARLLAALPPGEAAELLPEIEREKAARDAWFAIHGDGSSHAP
jgi:hypothetical protein